MTFLSPSPVEPHWGARGRGRGSEISFGRYCLSEAQKNVIVLLSWKEEESKRDLWKCMEILPKCQCTNCLLNYI